MPCSNAGENAPLAGQSAGELDGFLVAYRLDAVHHVEVERAGNEAGADSLNLVRARLPNARGVKCRISVAMV
jgi:hypothetical protein